MNTPLILKAPAKINLTLRVLFRRPDGFHEIETLMCPVGLADEISISIADEPGVHFSCSDATLPVDGTNLAVRAAEAFFRHNGLPPRLRLHLEKKIPHGAGLGGGSSDAATVLLGLNDLFGTAMPVEVLSRLAAELGSDIPFFVYRSAAICRGRGEKVEPVALPAPLPILLLKPSFGVPTPWAYSRWRDAAEVPGVLYAAQLFPWGTLVNDLERPVFEKYFYLAALKSWLIEQPEVAGALLSGSGSTVFAVLSEEGAGADAVTSLCQRVQAMFGEDLWTCRTTLANG